MMSIAIFHLREQYLPVTMHWRMVSRYIVLAVSRKRSRPVCDLDGWSVPRMLFSAVSTVGLCKWEVARTLSWQTLLLSTAGADPGKRIFCACSHSTKCAVT